MAEDNYEGILQQVGDYYTQKIHTHGPVHQGVDWNSTESQILRFRQLMKLHNIDQSFSINDYGCGYGALAEYLFESGFEFHYAGFDISEPMLNHARKLLVDKPNCIFVNDPVLLAPADYTVASGIFNVKFDIQDDQWKQYILETLSHIAKVSKLGFSFNMLTAYSDADRMRPNLFYADPHFFFDFCRTNFSRYVAVLHDYKLYEFTVLVRLL